MLMYGESRDDILGIGFAGMGVIYNLSSLREGFNTLRLLIPPNEIGRFTDRDFDIAYANYILNNDAVFCEFFQIIYNLYLGYDVFILASSEDWSENILESFSYFHITHKIYKEDAQLDVHKKEVDQQ